MSPPGPTKEAYNSLIYKLAAIETELKHTKKLLITNSNRSFWNRLWRLVAQASIMVMMICLLTTGGWTMKPFVCLITGNKYIESPSDFQGAYLMGLSDGFDFVIGMEDPIDIDLFSINTGGMTFNQLKAIVDKSMKDNPRLWHKPMSLIVFDAVVPTPHRKSKKAQ